MDDLTESERKALAEHHALEDELARKVQAEAMQPNNPEWTDDDFAKARPASEIHGPGTARSLVRGR